MKKAIIYTRVSTDEQAKYGFSLDHQQKIISIYCKQKEIEIIDHFQEDYSAKTFDRPEWNALLSYVQINKNLIDYLVFTKWDRFSRNVEESFRMIKKLRTLGIELICIEQQLDLTITENKLMLSFYLTIPEMENDRISSRTIDGMREAQKQGFWVGTAPLGYCHKRDVEGKSTLEENFQAPLVRKSFELIATGLYTCEEVRRQINKEYEVCKCKQAFINLLHNIAYTGQIMIKGHKKEDAQIVKGIHNPIVSIELFNQVQDVLTGRRKQPKHHIRMSDYLHLRGHLKCPVCKGNLTGSASTGRAKTKHYYYHCQKGCKVRFRADEANKIFMDYLSKIKITEAVKNMYERVMRDIYKHKEGDKSKKVELIEKEIARFKKRKENAQNMRVDGTLSLEDFNDIKRGTEKQIAKLQYELVELRTVDANFLKYIEFTLRLIEKIDYFFEISPVEIKQKILV